MSKYKIEDLDFSLLSETESNFLKRVLKSKPFIWLLGIFLGINVIFAMAVSLIKSDSISTFFYFCAFTKALIFIILALWARSWSLTAAILLLLWHLYSNSQLISSNNSFSNLMYIVFSLVFLVGIFSVNTRRTLLKKVSMFG